jgi:5-methylcytosine-specific restriction endonuclease McrA
MNETLCRQLVKRRAVAWDPEADEHGTFFPCECCGVWTNAYEMHHRKFRSRGGLWTPANIILLCPMCHDNATNERPGAWNLNVASHEDPSATAIKLWYASKPVLLTDDGDWRFAA